ncbi:MAG TPA: DUF5666 domain-containing protein [Ktedonobacteraceae bacterium]|jgi:hypothetical protein
MRRYFYPNLQKMIVSVAGLLMLMFVAGCAGVSSVGPNFSVQGTNVTSNSGGSQGGAPVPGSISFIGPVQSVNSSSIVAKLPNGQSLTAKIVSGQTDLSDFNGGLPSQGQMVDMKATTNTDGSFTAAEIKPSDSNDATDQNTVKFDGVVTSAVGADNVLHFRVGTQDFSFTLNATTDLSDFQNNARSIASNQAVEVKVQFQGTSATVIEVSAQNDQNDSQND